MERFANLVPNKAFSPKDWSVKSCRAIGRSAAIVQINSLLDEIKSSLHTIYHDIQRRDNYVTAEKVKNEFLGHGQTGETLLDMFAKHNEDVKALVGISKSPATFQKYEVTRKHLSDFIQYKYRISDISMNEITPMFINDFEVYLMTACKCSANTTAKFMQLFKRIVLIARNNGILVGDPFATYKIRLKKVDRGYLNDNEIKTIFEKEFASKRLEQVRDIFIFSCYTSLAYIDVKNLTAANIITSFDGNLWISTKRQKTDTAVNVPLLKIPLAIIEKYKDQRLPGGVLLPVLSNQKLNSYLKEIGDLCNINNVRSMNCH